MQCAHAHMCLHWQKNPGFSWEIPQVFQPMRTILIKSLITFFSIQLKCISTMNHTLVFMRRSIPINPTTGDMYAHYFFITKSENSRGILAQITSNNTWPSLHLNFFGLKVGPSETFYGPKFWNLKFSKILGYTQILNVNNSWKTVEPHLRTPLLKNILQIRTKF